MNGGTLAHEVAVPANREREALRQGADGSYNQSQMQDLINNVDELINALRL